MPRLSIIIPFLGDWSRLEDTLASVLQNRPADCQVVVALDTAYDDPYDLKGEVDFLQVSGDRGLTNCVNSGLAASRGEIAHILLPGIEIEPDWTDAAMRHFEDPRVAAVAPLILDRAAPERLLSAGLSYSASGAVRRLGRGKRVARCIARPISPCGPDTLAGFYRKSAFEAVGGMPRSMRSPVSGIDVALALREAGFLCLCEPASRTYADAGTLCSPSAFREGLDAERVFWRWAGDRGWLKSLAGHATLVGFECLGSLVRPANVCRIGGRLLGALDFPSHRRSEVRQPPRPSSAGVIRPPHFVNIECRKTAATCEPLAQ